MKLISFLVRSANNNNRKKANIEKETSKLILAVGHDFWCNFFYLYSFIYIILYIYMLYLTVSIPQRDDEMN